MSQNTGSNKTIVVSINPTHSAVKNVTLKTMFAVIDKQDSLLAAADEVIVAYKEKDEVQTEIIKNQTESISLITNNNELYKERVDFIEIDLKTANKKIIKLERRVKLFKNLSLSLPILSAAAVAYFKFK